VKGIFTLLGDYDNDGDLDLLISYNSNYSIYKSTTKLYRFEANQYVDSGIEFPYIDERSSASWIDYDNDNYLDLFFTMGAPFSHTTKLFRNVKGEKFIDANINNIFKLKVIWQGGVCWGDYDNDGDQDMLVQGTDNSLKWIIRIYENKGNGKFEDSGIQNIQGNIKSTKP
jgi:hypothetical protein